MPGLTLYQDYSREDVHNIFSPHTLFHMGSGTWGLTGIIPIPERNGDFIFMVTHGSSQSGHDFNEPISKEGVIIWQSQPHQKLHSPQIQQFITHDELNNSIYLFLRTQPSRDYTYLGLLKYISHNAEEENPVRFNWQILKWSIDDETLNRIGLTLEHEEETRPQSPGIVFTSPPSARPRGETSRDFRGHRTANTAEADARNRRLGKSGEELVLQEEKKTLIDAGRHDLAPQVQHVAVDEGDGAGYDVRSYSPSGDVKHIEVKTTRGGINTPFYITSNEKAFSSAHPQTYYLYRLWNFTTESASAYILKGDVSEKLILDPVNYRATVRT